MSGNEVVTATEAAEILGISVGRMYQLLAHREYYGLVAEKRAPRLWLIDRKSIEKFSKIDRPPGRAKR